MKPKHQRFLLIGVALLGIGVSTFLILTAFRENLVFFYTPSDLTQKKIHATQRIRIGGLVKPHSVQQTGEKIYFEITDHKIILKVSYDGLLPDLFREGQGIVAEGYLRQPDHFQAETVLAKHDENYMPPEVAERLKEEGLWHNAR
ncbi:MAG: cytochrome c maturation protein CcmE [Proteobacteria bacterium]|nr:cytochrome c maturation protein CcmE [Pseudomonadota bacterium]